MERTLSSKLPATLLICDFELGSRKKRHRSRASYLASKSETSSALISVQEMSDQLVEAAMEVGSGVWPPKAGVVRRTCFNNRSFPKEKINVNAKVLSPTLHAVKDKRPEARFARNTA
jgi:hypothetical protein